MSLPALTSSRPSGLHRSAALMRALGARASSVWASLAPEEAERLTAAMADLPEDISTETEAARAYVQDMAQRPSGAAPGKNAIWDTLGNMDGAALARLIEQESPQILAVILARLGPQTAAQTVRALPQALATEALHRLVKLGPIQPAALQALEACLEKVIAEQTSAENTISGHERVARIFDSLDSRAENGLLASLDRVEPGSGDRIRALMFTFDDLASLDPASLQTILAGTDRAVLIVALKGAKPDTAEAFFSNMTTRAGDLLRSEIETTGPVRRSEIEAARATIITLARTLVNRGDILSRETEDDELVE